MRVVTKKVRFSYVTIKEPRSMDESQKPKYSISLLIPKSDKEGVKKIQDAIEEVKKNSKSTWGGKVPATLKTPLRDGDEERPGEEAYEGMYFLNANSLRQPQVLDKTLQEILDLDELYSGSWGRASINFYAYNTAGSKGIAAGLQNLQKLEDDERLDGSVSAEADFGDEFESDDLS